MRMSEEELAALLSRRHAISAGLPRPKGKKTTAVPGEPLRLILPFQLPTWNQLFAMHHYQRAKVRNWIKKQIFTCIASGHDWPTPTGSALRLSLTDSSLLEYSQMIVPDSSRKYRLRKNSAK